MGEDFLACYEVDVIGATAFRENQFRLRPIDRIGVHSSCAFLHKIAQEQNKLFYDNKESKFGTSR